MWFGVYPHYIRRSVCVSRVSRTSERIRGDNNTLSCVGNERNLLHEGGKRKERDEIMCGSVEKKRRKTAKNNTRNEKEKIKEKYENEEKKDVIGVGVMNEMAKTEKKPVVRWMGNAVTQEGKRSKSQTQLRTHQQHTQSQHTQSQHTQSQHTQSQHTQSQSQHTEKVSEYKTQNSIQNSQLNRSVYTSQV
jgi:hypothetical protein